MIDQNYFKHLEILPEEHFSVIPRYDSPEILVMGAFLFFVGVTLLIGGGLL